MNRTAYAATMIVLAWVSSSSAQTSPRCFVQVDPHVYSAALTTDNVFRPFVVADFDSDGNSDIAVADPGTGGGVIIGLGNGNGGFSGGGTLMLNPAPAEIVTGDFNGDKIPDLAVASADILFFVTVSGQLQVLLGDGTGGFTSSATRVYQQAAPFRIAAGDVDGDGQDDLVVPLRATNSNFSGTITGTEIHLGDTAGGLTHSTTVGGGFVSTFVEDVNLDGAADLIETPNDLFQQGQDIEVRLADGQGGFALPVLSPSSWAPLVTPDLQDLNDDGAPDLVSASDAGVTTQLGDGAGGFGPALTSPAGSSSNCFFTYAKAADFDGDGATDLAVHYPAGCLVGTATMDPGEVTVLRGDGQGGFSAPSELRDVDFDGPMDVGDFDGNGVPDLVLNAPYAIVLGLTSCFPYGGSGEDLTLTTQTVGAAREDPIKNLGFGESIAITWSSPGGAFIGAPACLASQIYASGSPVPSPPGHPEVHINPAVSPFPIELYVEPSLPPSGVVLHGTAGPGFVGHTLLVQAFALTPSASNGFFAATDAHHLSLVDRGTPFIGSGEVSDVATREIEIRGGGFSLAATVKIDGVTVTPLAISPGSIRATLPTNSTGCNFGVSVTNPDGQSDARPLAAGVLILSVTPTIVGGNGGHVLTVTGSGFAPGSSVTIDGSPATVLSMTRGRIEVVTPPAPAGLSTLQVTALPGCTDSIQFLVL